MLCLALQGVGTREGSGKCSCDSGYEGDVCDECADLYFEEQGDDSKPKCTGESDDRPQCHVEIPSFCRLQLFLRRKTMFLVLEVYSRCQIKDEEGTEFGVRVM